MINTESLKKSITKAEELKDILKLREEEVIKLEDILEKYPMCITPYYLSLINFEDENDPIKKMCIPSIEETDISGSFDTDRKSVV